MAKQMIAMQPPEATLPLSRITIDTTLQPRITGLDATHVRMLQDVPESWLPLIVVQQDGRHILVDGFHRFAAAQNLGLAMVPVQAMDPPADGDLHALAFALNAAHGRPLSLADRRAFAERLLHQHPEWADREIGRRCGLSSNTVGSLREKLEQGAQIEQPSTRVGAGGYVYTVGTNARQRSAGELPEAGVVEMVGDALGRWFTSADRVQHRQIAHYLKRLAVALEDQTKLKGWETAEDAAEACRLVFKPERAKVLATHLGSTSRKVLEVALLLGYAE
jgi:hypothetical protein